MAKNNERQSSLFEHRNDNFLIHPLGTILTAGVGVMTALIAGGPVFAFMAGAFGAVQAAQSKMHNPAAFLLKANKHDELPPEHRVSKMVADLARKAGLKTTPHCLVERPRERRGRNQVQQMPFACTLGTTKSSAIIISPGLETQMTPMELEAVLAHEIAHLKNRDTESFTLLRTAGSLTHMALLFAIISPLLGVPPLAASATIAIGCAMIGNMMISSAVSRAAERRADRGSAALTKNPWALSAALGRFSELGLESLKGMGYRKPGMLQKKFLSLFRTHPSTRYRRTALEQLGAHMIVQDPQLATIKQTTLAASDLFSAKQVRPIPMPWGNNNDRHFLTQKPAALPSILPRTPLFNQAAREQDNQPASPISGTKATPPRPPAP